VRGRRKEKEKREKKKRRVPKLRKRGGPAHRGEEKERSLRCKKLQKRKREGRGKERKESHDVLSDCDCFHKGEEPASMGFGRERSPFQILAIAATRSAWPRPFLLTGELSTSNTKGGKKPGSQERGP